MNEPKTLHQDPVCSTPVDEATALDDEYNGKSFYFCSYFCRHQYLAVSEGINLAERFESCREQGFPHREQAMTLL